MVEALDGKASSVGETILTLHTLTRTLLGYQVNGFKLLSSSAMTVLA